MDFRRVEAERVENQRRFPDFVAEHFGIAGIGAQAVEHGLLQREDEGGRFAGAESLARAALRDPRKEFAYRNPNRTVGVEALVRADGGRERREKLARLQTEFGLGHQLSSGRNTVELQ